MSNSNVTIRMDDELKKQADELFDSLGMSFTTAINIFVRQSVRNGCLPFEVTTHPRMTHDPNFLPISPFAPSSTVEYLSKLKAAGLTL